jgi:hypothetical protein
VGPSTSIEANILHECLCLLSIVSDIMNAAFPN